MLKNHLHSFSIYTFILSPPSLGSSPPYGERLVDGWFDHYYLVRTKEPEMTCFYIFTSLQSDCLCPDPLLLTTHPWLSSTLCSSTLSTLLSSPLHVFWHAALFCGNLAKSSTVDDTLWFTAFQGKHLHKTTAFTEVLLQLWHYFICFRLIKGHWLKI